MFLCKPRANEQRWIVARNRNDTIISSTDLVRRSAGITWNEAYDSLSAEGTFMYGAEMSHRIIPACFKGLLAVATTRSKTAVRNMEFDGEVFDYPKELTMFVTHCKKSMPDGDLSVAYCIPTGISFECGETDALRRVVETVSKLERLKIWK